MIHFLIIDFFADAMPWFSLSSLRLHWFHCCQLITFFDFRYADWCISSYRRFLRFQLLFLLRLRLLIFSLRWCRWHFRLFFISLSIIFFFLRLFRWVADVIFLSLSFFISPPLRCHFHFDYFSHFSLFSDIHFFFSLLIFRCFSFFFSFLFRYGHAELYRFDYASDTSIHFVHFSFQRALAIPIISISFSISFHYYFVFHFLRLLFLSWFVISFDCFISDAIASSLLFDYRSIDDFHYFLFFITRYFTFHFMIDFLFWCWCRFLRFFGVSIMPFSIISHFDAAISFFFLLRLLRFLCEAFRADIFFLDRLDDDAFWFFFFFFFAFIDFLLLMPIGFHFSFFDFFALIIFRLFRWLCDAAYVPFSLLLLCHFHFISDRFFFIDIIFSLCWYFISFPRCDDFISSPLDISMIIDACWCHYFSLFISDFRFSFHFSLRLIIDVRAAFRYFHFLSFDYFISIYLPLYFKIAFLSAAATFSAIDELFLSSSFLFLFSISFLFISLFDWFSLADYFLLFIFIIFIIFSMPMMIHWYFQLIFDWYFRWCTFDDVSFAIDDYFS